MKAQRVTGCGTHAWLTVTCLWHTCGLESCCGYVQVTGVHTDVHTGLHLSRSVLWVPAEDVSGFSEEPGLPLSLQYSPRPSQLTLLPIRATAVPFCKSGGSDVHREVPTTQQQIQHAPPSSHPIVQVLSTTDLFLPSGSVISRSQGNGIKVTRSWDSSVTLIVWMICFPSHFCTGSLHTSAPLLLFYGH